MKKEGFIQNNIVDTTPTNDSAIGTTRIIKFISIVTPLAFVADIFAMWKLNLRGGDATALVGGTSIIIMLLITLTNYKFNDALEKVVDYLKDGFGFGIKVFAPVIIIGGFFFM